MTEPTSSNQGNQERDLQTPRPADHQQSQEDSASPSPSNGDPGSGHGQRKSFSSLSARSSVSLSTSYSSADDHSEVGELPAESGGSLEVRVQTERQGSGNSGTVPSQGKIDQTGGDIGALEQELADMDLKSGQETNNVVDDDEDEDSYLDDPLVKYTLQLHDYTVSLDLNVAIKQTAHATNGS